MTRQIFSRRLEKKCMEDFFPFHDLCGANTPKTTKSTLKTCERDISYYESFPKKCRGIIRNEKNTATLLWNRRKKILQQKSFLTVSNIDKRSQISR